MKLPFTTEDFFKVFENYNLAVWPVQYALALLALVAALAVIRKKTYSRYVSAILSFLWLWMGVVYHIIFFSPINKVAYFFGAVFIVQGLLFLVKGFLQPRLSFQFKKDIYGLTGGALILFSLIVYPLIGYASGHIYPSSPTFGLPCPTTIFTFALLLWIDRCPLYLFVIPFLWALVGFSAAFTLGIKEDSALLMAAVIAAILLLVKNKAMRVS